MIGKNKQTKVRSCPPSVGYAVGNSDPLWPPRAKVTWYDECGNRCVVDMLGCLDGGNYRSLIKGALRQYIRGARLGVSHADQLGRALGQ